MNVLSLFDGISCGQIAISRSGLAFDNYFASETDRDCISVTQLNFPKTIQIGCIEKVNIDNLPRIDLLIGGSPCQGFSFAGNGLNFNDDRSSLFFSYFDIFVKLKKANPGIAFLFENVPMKNWQENSISRRLGVLPLKINSRIVSKQNRRRLYWTNIKFKKFDKSDDFIFGKQLYRLGHGFVSDEIRLFDKYPCLTAQNPGTKYRIVTDFNSAIECLKSGDTQRLRTDQAITRQATPEECEDFQTIPIGYTSMLNKTKRFSVIGNGWTVDVISMILKGIA